MRYTFAVAMLLAGSVDASGQINPLPGSKDQTMWSVSMDNDKFKEIAADDKEIDQDVRHFIDQNDHVKHEMEHLTKKFHKKFLELEKRLGKTGQMLQDPKYQAELEAIVKTIQTLDAKVKKALKWDDEGLKMWKLRMNNDEFKEIAADDQAIKNDLEKFVSSHPKINRELQDLSLEIEAEFKEISARLEKTASMLKDPNYKKELEVIAKKMQILDQKLKANLHWDDEGLKMWKLSMNPKLEFTQGKYCSYELFPDTEFLYRDLLTHIDSSKPLDQLVLQCKELCTNNPKCEIIMVQNAHRTMCVTDDCSDRRCWLFEQDREDKRQGKPFNPVWSNEDDTYLKKKCFDKPKPEEIWQDIEDLEAPGKALLKDFEEFEQDQAIHGAKIERLLEEAIVKLNTPKHRQQLAKIKARWDALQVHQNQEMAGLHGDIEQFVFQEDVSAELEDLENDIAKILSNMKKREEDFQHELQGMQPFFTDMERKLRAISVKLNHLATTVKQNIQFDAETKMWKLSMDNKVSDGLKNDQEEIFKDGEKFIESNPEVEAEMKDLSCDLMKELHEIQAEMQESAKMLEDPRYKADLEAIVNKMKALDMKFKNNLKIEQ